MGLGLYLHIPFCQRKCPYCDFNTYAGLESLFDATVEALCLEIGSWQESLAGRSFSTVFVGGGTPTVLESRHLARLFAAIGRCFSLEGDCEITCEANPGTVDRTKFAVLRDLGVNRLSLGVQSLQPDDLRFLGRIHGVTDVDRAVVAARSVGFANINLDFIFGLPNQSQRRWEDTLDRALALAPEHLSLYSLIVEPNTPLFHWVEDGLVTAPDEDAAAELYEAALAKLDGAGYVHYEVSNWAKTVEPSAVPTEPSVASAPGLAPLFACRHNLLYWRNQEYLGIGPGAHSHLRWMTADGVAVDRRWSNYKSVPGYVKRLQRGEPIEASSETIDRRLSMGETMMLGLRLVHEGVEYARFRAWHDADLLDVFGAEVAQLRQWNLLDVQPDRVRLTRQGLMVGNQVFMRFLPDAGVIS